MTVRNERAVRVGPGTTLDPQGTRVGELTSLHRTVAAVGPSGNPGGQLAIVERKHGLGSGRPVGLSSSTLDQAIAFQSMESQRKRVKARDERSHSPNPESRSLLSSSLSNIYELEHHRGALEILLLLGDEGSVTKSRLRQCLKPGPEALGGALQSLVGLGLIESQSIRAFPFAKCFRLTQRGKALLAAPLHAWPSVIPE
jgi:hypothetical protein